DEEVMVMRKPKTTLFNAPIGKSLKSTASKLLQLNKLKKDTARYLKIHNEVVELLWKIQHQLEQQKNEPHSKNYDTFKKLEKNILLCLEKNNSTGILEEKIQEIYALEKELNPKNAAEPSSPSFQMDLKK
ncbi:MAG TPA: hypothetical protein VHA13_01710, partial [Gammaproteobacteria bacterium]|nr:hypothetical protein [Gammaproteobacteria bacterium]